MSKGNTLPLSKTRSGTKKFSALTFENFKYQRFLNGFPPDIDGFFPGIIYTWIPLLPLSLSDRQILQVL